MSDTVKHTPPAFELPTIQAESQRYWDAAAQGLLIIKHCNDCDQPHFYPRTNCPFCSSQNTVWIECGGGGSIYSYTVIRRGLPRVQAVAYVTLDEGPTVMGEIVTDNLGEISIGQRVQAGFSDFAGRPHLFFRPG